MFNEKSALAQARRTYLGRCEERWGSAVLVAKRWLTFNEGEDEYCRKIRLLAAGLLSTRALSDIFGVDSIIPGWGDEKLSWPRWATPSVVERLEMLDPILGGKIIDDGMSGVGYWRYSPGRARPTAEMCRSTEEGARPFFHRDVNNLWIYYPTARRLTVDTALEALSFYKEKHPRSVEEARVYLEARDVTPTRDIIKAVLEGSPADRLAQQIADEFLGQVEQPPPPHHP